MQSFFEGSARGQVRPELDSARYAVAYYQQWNSPIPMLSREMTIERSPISIAVALRRLEY
jgi:hypothetical protein